MKKRVSNTVNLSAFEKEHIKKKYQNTYSKKSKTKKKKESKDITPMENDNGDNGSFFKYAYRFYYTLDLPPEEAYKSFKVCMRASSDGKVVAYLYDYGIQNKEELIQAVQKSTVEYRERIEDKFEFISNKIKEIMFERLTK
jgi:hypothetical protein